MTLSGRVTFISLEIRESKKNGKTYYYANLEDNSGSLVRVNVEEAVLKKLEGQKYKKMDAWFLFGVYNNSGFLRLLDVTLLE